MVQFFAKLGCGLTVGMSPPVYLQYSIDGGVHWISIEQFDFNTDSNLVSYLSIHLPPHARTNATQMRWWQPSSSGVYSEDWAVDQVTVFRQHDFNQKLKTNKQNLILSFSPLADILCMCALLLFCKTSR